MIAWPTRLDGTNLTIAEMTPADRDALVADAKARTRPTRDADEPRREYLDPQP